MVSGMNFSEHTFYTDRQLIASQPTGANSSVLNFENIGSRVASLMADGQQVVFKSCNFKVRMNANKDCTLQASTMGMNFKTEFFLVVAANGTTITSGTTGRSDIRTMLDAQANGVFSWQKIGEFTSNGDANYINVAGQHDWIQESTKWINLNLTKVANLVAKNYCESPVNTTPVVCLVAITNSNTVIDSMNLDIIFDSVYGFKPRAAAPLLN